jgi:hypothetical protein
MIELSRSSLPWRRQFGSFPLGYQELLEVLGVRHANRREEVLAGAKLAWGGGFIE